MGVTQNLYALFGNNNSVGITIVFAVGDNGTLIHHDIFGPPCFIGELFKQIFKNKKL